MTMLRPGCRRRYPGRTALLAEREATEVRPAAAHAAASTRASRDGRAAAGGKKRRIAYFWDQTEENSSESAMAKPKGQCV